MKTQTLLSVVCVFTACAQLPATSDTAQHDAVNKPLGDRYLSCVSREAEKEMKNPAGAEDIAAAAHGRCWTLWEAYSKATRDSFVRDAQSSAEIQLAQDKADAHLRQFEREARQGVVNSVVQRTLKPKAQPGIQ